MVVNNLQELLANNNYKFLAIDNQSQELKKNCAIVQTGAVHEEIIPSIVYILNILGFNVDIYLNQNSVIRKGNIFIYFKKISYRLFLVNLGYKASWHKLIAEISDRVQYQLVVSSTFQRDPVAQWLSSCELPSICIPHNVQMLLRTKNCLDYLFNRDNSCAMFLAKHVYQYACSQSPELAKVTPQDSFIYPIYFEDLKSNSKIINDRYNKHPRTFVIQGTIHYGKRDYGELIAAIKELTKNGISSSQLQIVMAGTGQDKERLIEDIRHQGVKDFFLFLNTQGEKVLYDSYYDSILNSDYLLPMINDSNPQFVTNKITSSLMIVLGMNVIPIIHDSVADTYGVSNIKYSSHEELVKAIKTAIDLDYPDYYQMHLDLKSQNILLTEQSIKNMSNALTTIGVSNN